jgi:hypothetical protein
MQSWLRLAAALQDFAKLMINATFECYVMLCYVTDTHPQVCEAASGAHPVASCGAQPLHVSI